MQMLTTSILNQHIYICLEVENHNYCGNGILSKPDSDHRFLFIPDFNESKHYFRLTFDEIVSNI
jgi:hypothetical protein